MRFFFFWKRERYYTGKKDSQVPEMIIYDTVFLLVFILSADG